jgi:hypothetical protein
MSRPTTEKVVLAYLHPGLVHAAFMECVVDLLVYDTAFHQRIVSGGGRLATQAGANLSGPRNGLVKRFLEYGKADWLLMLDTDMTFRPDLAERLLEFADPDDAPIVGGLCFGLDDKGDIQPTLFGLVGDEAHPQVIRYHEWPPEAMFQVAATGAACLLLHKTALERIRDFELPGRPGKRGFNAAFPWFQELEHDGTPVSEDIAFCWRAGLAGVPVWVNTAVQLGHIKDRELTMDAYLAQRGRSRDEQGEDEVRRLRAEPPPPATERTAVIVPVLGRPQNAAPFMESLKSSGADVATVYAVYTIGDDETARAWLDAGAEIVNGAVEDMIEGRPLGNQDTWAHTFAEKVNLGYRETTEPWLFLVGDDVRFHPGWLDHAQAAAGDRFHVVGTNDLGNPRVLAGEHATHLLIRRKYADGWGVSWDGPGVVAHEGYRHWYVDDEIVTAAKARGVWAPCLDAVVEHLHPFFGKAATDEVYRLGAEHAEADLALFEQRCKEYL